MAISTRAHWIIERNLASELSLESIAAGCGVSRYHLAHAFGQVTGASVMDFVRGRRLSEAAKELAEGASDILDVALSSGYDSHEAFSRAFKKRFWATPEDVRRRGSVADLQLVAPVKPPVVRHIEIARPSLRDQAEILAVGVEARYAFGEAEGIAQHWQRFMAAQAHDITGRLPTIPIGITTNIDGDGGFYYLTAVEVAKIGSVPRGLTSVRIASRRWAVFQHPGHITELPATYAAIWDDGLGALGLTVDDAPSIERHSPSFDPQTGYGGVEIWLPLKP